MGNPRIRGPDDASGCRRERQPRFGTLWTRMISSRTGRRGRSVPNRPSLPAAARRRGAPARAEFVPSRASYRFRRFASRGVRRLPSPRSRGEGEDEGLGALSVRGSRPEPLTPALSPQAGRGGNAPRRAESAHQSAVDDRSPASPGAPPPVKRSRQRAAKASKDAESAKITSTRHSTVSTPSSHSRLSWRQ